MSNTSYRTVRKGFFWEDVPPVVRMSETPIEKQDREMREAAEALRRQLELMAMLCPAVVQFSQIGEPTTVRR